MTSEWGTVDDGINAVKTGRSRRAVLLGEHAF